MHILSVQEQDDKTIKFEGSISEQEASIVLAVGLNAMLHMGMMHMIPDVEYEEGEPNEEDGDEQLDLFDVSDMKPS
jgi:hypothetical protein